MSITLSQIARMAGCSKSQASKAIRGRGRVSPQLIEEVRRIAQEHGYVAHGPARALRRGRKDAYAVLWGRDVPFSSEFINLIAWGVQSWLDEHSPRHLIVARAKEPSGEISPVVRQRWVDGVVLTGEPPPELVTALGGSGVPVVLASDRAEAAPWVSCDDQNAAQTAVNYLYDLGHRRVAYVYVSLHPGHEHISIRARLEGYRVACRRKGIATREYCDGIATLKTDVEQLLRSPERPTAILCYSDQDCLRVFNLLARHGIRVPEEISLLGFDDSHVCDNAFMPLSTMKIPYKEMGYHACRMLEDRIENPGLAPEHMVVQAQLIERESTAPPAEALASVNGVPGRQTLQRTSVSTKEGQ